MPKQYRVRVSELQALADSVKAGEVPLAHLQKKVKVWVSEMKKHLRMTGPKKGSAGAAIGSTMKINHWLKRISLQLEQMTEAKVPVPETSMVEDEFGENVVVGE
ncbi:hypothetical protein BDDG_12185 [Blastomyces dermatitidis ATCC 18188]|uniref:Uncharacterized protein n=1 Tax=Ajellomyces dermatitidis (strain ATCC 18188 / CBS 674.68) TaxID=653446 RepID=A0A0J9HEV6_AJEDA|nr:hypothetical protein BDDG_12185 [Blastomyces dermatitidis ATCC 18188]